MRTPSGSEQGSEEGSEEGTAPSPTGRRMGWRSFLPLVAVGVGVILLLRPGGGALELHDWSRHLSGRGGHAPFALASSPNDGSPEEAAEIAGIRWVHLRIALAAGRPAEVDSLARILADALPDTSAAATALAGWGDRMTGSVPPSRARVETTEDALVAYFGPDFEEAAVLETLRRAAASSASQLAEELVGHPSLMDGEGEDVPEEHLTKLMDLCRGALTEGELVEMETIVTDILRRRT